MSAQRSSQRRNWAKGEDGPAVSTLAIIGWRCSELLALKKERILCVQNPVLGAVPEDVTHNSGGQSAVRRFSKWYS